MTVYKPFEKEAEAAAAMALALGRGESAEDVATTTIDSATRRDIPAILLTPTEVTARDVEGTLVRDGVYTVGQICLPELRAACDRLGLTRCAGRRPAPGGAWRQPSREVGHEERSLVLRPLVVLAHPVPGRG
jgi:hypothetical protein